MIDVLIADDHALFRQGFEVLLKTLDTIQSVHHAENGEEVLVVLEKNKVDIVFMDIRMPIMNGIETTLKVKELFPTAKIIAISMMDDKVNILNMIRAGADGYILKHASFTEIQLAILTVQEGDKYFSIEISKIINTKDVEKTKTRKFKEFPDLTEREREIIALICQSYTNKEIGEKLFISDRTIGKHREHIHRKLNIDKVVDLIFFAIENGIINKVDDD